MLLALTCVLSPRERILGVMLFVGSNGYLTNPAPNFAKTRKQFLLLLGEKAGMREDKKLTSVFGFTPALTCVLSPPERSLAITLPSAWWLSAMVAVR